MSNATIVTDMVRGIIDRTLDLHPCGGVFVWYGKARIGKTTAAELLVQRTEEVVASGKPAASRAAHYQAGWIGAGSGNMRKKALRSLYRGALQRETDPALHRRLTGDELASALVLGLRKKKIEMIAVDEAHALPPAALRWMTSVCRVAEDMGSVLSLILVGDESLPGRVSRAGTLERRVTECFHFTEYDFDETWSLLADLHPHFKGLDRQNESHRRQVEFLHQTFGGYPGHLVPFLKLMEDFTFFKNRSIDENYLRLVYAIKMVKIGVSLGVSTETFPPAEEVYS